MLATAGDAAGRARLGYEFKWDGVRALAVVAGERTRLYARSGAEITEAYPELAGLGAALADAGSPTPCSTARWCSWTRTGGPSFMALAERMHVRDASRARQLAATLPVTYMIFDMLSATARDVSAVPYVERRQLLESILPAAWIVHALGGAAAVRRRRGHVAAAPETALEGVVAKRLDVDLPSRAAVTRLDQGQARPDRRLRGRRLAARPRELWARCWSACPAGRAAPSAAGSAAASPASAERELLAR